MTLGQKLKELRIKKGLTQKDLADQLHVSFQTISKWENNENEPDIATLRELAKLYDCSVDFLINEDEEQTNEVAEEKEEPTEPVTKTIIIHQKELHVCERCKKDIPENELEIGRICTRAGGRGHSAEYRPAYYHKKCYQDLQRENEEKAAAAKAAHASNAKKKCWGWGIASGVVALGLSLTFLLIYGREYFPIWAIILMSIGAEYAVFADLYCILSGSYIGEVFTTVASWTIRFPGLIFSWDLGGLAWLIGMKILFAILGFLLTVGLFLLAVSLSAGLAAVSFPFILIHNINNDYADAF